jgi:uncharacterized membrane protein YbhN (UPF0104 family)
MPLKYGKLKGNSPPVFYNRSLLWQKTLIKMANKKSAALLLLKLAVSLSILVLILTTQTSLREIGNVLRSVNLYWLALAFSLHSFGLFASA